MIYPHTKAGQRYSISLSGLEVVNFPECFRKTKLLAFFDESTFLDPSFFTYQLAQVEQT